MSSRDLRGGLTLEADSTKYVQGIDRAITTLKKMEDGTKRASTAMSQSLQTGSQRASKSLQSVGQSAQSATTQTTATATALNKMSQSARTAGTSATTASQNIQKITQTATGAKTAVGNLNPVRRRCGTYEEFWQLGSRRKPQPQQHATSNEKHHG